MDPYILEPDGTIRKVDLAEWGRYFSTVDRRIGYDEVGEVKISTVFLGMDHNWRNDGFPILFETMTFGPEPWDERCWRYGTKKAAEAGHKFVTDIVKLGGKPSDVFKVGDE